MSKQQQQRKNIPSNECRYCHETGHSKNTCPKLQNKKTNVGGGYDNRNNTQQSNRNNTQRVVKKHEPSVNEIFESNFPVFGLCKPVTSSWGVAHVNGSSFLDMVSKEPVVEVESDLKDDETIINGQVFQILK